MRSVAEEIVYPVKVEWNNVQMFERLDDLVPLDCVECRGGVDAQD